MILEFEFKGVKFKVTPEGTYDKSIWLYRPDHDAYYTDDGTMIDARFLACYKRDINYIARKLVEAYRREEAQKAIDAKLSTRALPEPEIMTDET